MIDPKYNISKIKTYRHNRETRAKTLVVFATNGFDQKPTIGKITVLQTNPATDPQMGFKFEFQ